MLNEITNRLQLLFEEYFFIKVLLICGNTCKKRLFTVLVLGRFGSGAPFRDVFLILVALSPGAVLKATFLQEDVRRGW